MSEPNGKLFLKEFTKKVIFGPCLSYVWYVVFLESTPTTVNIEGERFTGKRRYIDTTTFILLKFTPGINSFGAIRGLTKRYYSILRKMLRSSPFYTSVYFRSRYGSFSQSKIKSAFKKFEYFIDHFDQSALL